jgi:hypothetical protein
LYEGLKSQQTLNEVEDNKYYTENRADEIGGDEDQKRRFSLLFNLRKSAKSVGKSSSRREHSSSPRKDKSG